jgi:methionine--tRNA ligase beta chain
MATINDFLSLDIRVGKIIEVVELESRKPMYGLKIDLGELGIKNIAAGIKNAYQKDELIGKNVIVLVNIEPKNIAGFSSEGMVLAAESDAVVSVLLSDKEIPPGSRVR